MQHVHYFTAMWWSIAEAATVPDCSHLLYISSLPGSLSERAKYGGSSGTSALQGRLPADALCSLMHVHLTPGHTRHIMDVIAWCRSQLLILKTYEISAFHGLLGILEVIKNTQLTAGSLGSRGRTCSTLVHLLLDDEQIWAMHHIPAKRHGAGPHAGTISKYPSLRCAERLKIEEGNLFFPGV